MLCKACIGRVSVCSRSGPGYKGDLWCLDEVERERASWTLTVCLQRENTLCFSQSVCKHHRDIALGYELLTEAVCVMLNLKYNIFGRPASTVEYLHPVVGRYSSVWSRVNHSPSSSSPRSHGINPFTWQRRVFSRDQRWQRGSFSCAAPRQLLL